jgi:hypothetical protein
VLHNFKWPDIHAVGFHEREKRQGITWLAFLEFDENIKYLCV